jgi:PAS domain S-box-containing protein
MRTNFFSLQSLHSRIAMPAKKPRRSGFPLAKSSAAVHTTQELSQVENSIWRLVADSALDAIIAIRSDGTIILWNQTAASVFGWQSSEVDGKVFVELVLPEAHRKEIKDYMLRYLKTEDDTIFDKRLEIFGLAKDGREFPIELSIVPQKAKEGHTFVAFVRDMTDERALNEHLRQSQKMEAIGMLAGGMAHEFNNILATISGNLVLARGDVPSDHPIVESLSEIEKATTRATYVVRQILNFVAAGEVIDEAIDLEVAVKEAIKLLRSTLPASTEIELVCEKGLPAVRAETNEVHQVVLNLGINAQQAMGSQSGKFGVKISTVTLDKGKAESMGITPGPYVRVSAHDSGCGMDEQTLQRVFEPFFTTKAVGEGTGLGLAIVYGIVTRHLGAISVESELCVGTTFHIYFPAVKVATKKAVAKAVVAVAGNKERILFVDDDEALVLMLTRTLRRLNYDVNGFQNPQQALAAFTADPDGFDVVITDLSMPNMDGATLVQELRAIRPEIPIVMITGFIRPMDLEQALQLGISELILKPNTATEMGEVLHRIFTETTKKEKAVSSSRR